MHNVNVFMCTALSILLMDMFFPGYSTTDISNEKFQRAFNFFFIFFPECDPS